MALHFERAELSARRAKTVARLEAAGLDGLLMFRQESMFYLTGYDTFGYVFFQCLYLGADGRIALITRAPDLRQAQHTSDIEDIRIWVDGPDVNPALQLRDMLAEFGCGGKKLGVEYDAYGLTAANGKKLDAALDGFCTLISAPPPVLPMTHGMPPLKPSMQVRLKATYWPPCRALFSKGAGIIPAMNSLSVPDAMHCFAVTSPGANIWLTRIRSRWNGQEPIGIIMLR